MLLAARFRRWGGQGGKLVAEVDLAWPHHRFCVELDGWASHGHRDAFRKDRARDRALVALGWTVLRYTWSDVASDRTSLIAEINAALRRIEEFSKYAPVPRNEREEMLKAYREEPAAERSMAENFMRAGGSK